MCQIILNLEKWVSFHNYLLEKGISKTICQHKYENQMMIPGLSFHGELVFLSVWAMC